MSDVTLIPVNKFIEVIYDLFNLFEKNNKNEKPEGEEPMTVEETCKFLGCSKVTLHKYKKTGLIKARRIGRRIYFLKHEILEAMKKDNFKKK